MSKPNPKTLSETNDAFVTWRPSVLKHNSHGWNIEYYALDPACGKLKRHVLKLNVLRKHCSRLTDFKRQAELICIQINGKLAGGWTPFGESQNARMLLPIGTVADIYIKEKETELRPDTVINYRSFCKTLKEWIESESSGMPIGSFNRLLAIRFMDDLFSRGLRGRSWNNRLKQGRAFFAWAVEKCYAKENPFSTIKPKREEPKKRVLIPAETRKRITEYWSSRNPKYLVLCQLVFSALIRPKEAWRLCVGDVCLKEGYIYVSESEAKTHYSRVATITPALRDLLQKAIEGHDRGDRLFGKDYATGPAPIAYSRFRKDWDAMRKELKLPDEMQLYSLRDTGINEMLKSGIDPLTVMQHADHHDLSMTTRYANHVDPHLVEVISKKAPGF